MVPLQLLLRPRAGPRGVARLAMDSEGDVGGRMDLADGAISVDMAAEGDEAAGDSTIGAADGSTIGAGACRAVNGGEARRRPKGTGIGGAVVVVVGVEEEAEGVEGGSLSAIMQALCRRSIN